MERIPDSAWANSLSLDRIPAAIGELAAVSQHLAALSQQLTARLIANSDSAGGYSQPTSDPLVDASEMARRLNVKESWVRSEQRAGRIPFVQVGRYVRFRAAEVEAVIVRRQAE